MQPKLLVLPMIALGCMLPLHQLRLAAIASSAPLLQVASQAPFRKLTPYVRATIAKLSADSGVIKRTVLIAGAPGKNAAIAQHVVRAHGSVLYQLYRVGYLRAQLPVSEIERLADLPEVEALDIVGLRPRPHLPFSSDTRWRVPSRQAAAPADRLRRNAPSCSLRSPPKDA